MRMLKRVVPGGIFRNAVVPLQRKIIEPCPVAPPAGHIGSFAAHDVSGSGHLHVAETEGALDEHDFEFYCRPWFHITWGQEIDAAGTDIARDESNGNGLRDSADSQQAKRQRKGSTRRAASIACYADRVRRNARKPPRPRPVRNSRRGFSLIFLRAY